MKSLKKAKRFKPFKPFRAWMLVDDLDTYQDSIHIRRRDAVTDLEHNRELIDSKWRIVKVKVSPA